MSPRERLGAARLYLVCDARPLEWLRAALRGGVDLVQLRDRSLDDAGVVAAAQPFRTAASEAGALFILNDRPDLVAACDADGVHVGQDDATPAAARSPVRPGPGARASRPTPAPAPRAARPGRARRAGTRTSPTWRSGRCTRRRPSRGGRRRGWTTSSGPRATS